MLRAALFFGEFMQFDDAEFYFEKLLLCFDLCLIDQVSQEEHHAEDEEHEAVQPMSFPPGRDMSAMSMNRVIMCENTQCSREARVRLDVDIPRLGLREQRDEGYENRTATPTDLPENGSPSR